MEAVEEKKTLPCSYMSTVIFLLCEQQQQTSDVFGTFVPLQFVTGFNIKHCYKLPSVKCPPCPPPIHFLHPVTISDHSGFRRVHIVYLGKPDPHTLEPCTPLLQLNVCVHFGCSCHDSYSIHTHTHTHHTWNTF